MGYEQYAQQSCPFPLDKEVFQIVWHYALSAYLSFRNPFNYSFIPCSYLYAFGNLGWYSFDFRDTDIYRINTRGYRYRGLGNPIRGAL